MTIPHSEIIAALVADLGGPAGDALGATLERLPVTLALSCALYLARCDDPAGRELARKVFAALRPLAGETVRVDDDLAWLALSLGDPAAAAAILDMRLARSEALSAYQRLARAYLALGRDADARALAERLQRDAGDRVTTWLIVGEVMLGVGDFAAAERAYQHAVTLAPTGTSGLLGVAQCLAAQGDPSGARSHVARVFAAYQDAPSTWVLREVLEVAARLGDAEWIAELQARLAQQNAREAATLRAMVVSALDQSDAPSSPPRRDRVRIATARERLRAAVPNLPADDGDDAQEVPPQPEEEPPPDHLLEALRDHFGYDSFLPGQVTVIQAALRGEDVLVLMPTGAGKSLCYQLPALLLPGMTVLISPLIALMKDQVEGLPAAVRGRATVINSLVERDELERRLLDVAAGRYKLVYAAPERLRQQSFIYALRRAGISRFVVDEAHCVSLWGHDFRPDYLFIAKALNQLGESGQPLPVLALTATATPEVRESIAEALGRDLRVVNRGVFRPNLRYEVVHVGNKEDRLRALATIVEKTPGAGIIYVRSREGCEEVAEFLRRRCHVSAQHYHAGMQRAERDAAQDAFIAGRTRVIVATVAFGMGIDKPDVRFIVHFQLPGSLEAYVQESGRAGRDGQPSRCILFASAMDVSQLRRHIRQDELSIETLRAVYAAARDLVRAGAPPPATAGRVAAADLEREVSAAIEASGRPVDESVARVALSLLERAGFLRRHPDVPRAPTIRMGMDLPADPADAAGFHAFTQAARLRPYQFQTLDLVALATQLGLAHTALEERLLAWRDAGLVEYRDGMRDLLLEIPAPPSDGKTALPALLAALAERHERQVASLVAYTQAPSCRQRVIAQHFGERLPVSRCGACDRCRGTPSTTAPVASRPRRLRSPSSASDPAAVRATILACVRDLPYAVGISGLVRVLTGSVDTPASAARSPHFGALAGISRDRLAREVQLMVAEGLMERDDGAEYPVVRVRTER
ncbi:MAG: hypothetical protein PVSMB4_03180 [Ktedonobacterales bacterium]